MFVVLKLPANSLLVQRDMSSSVNKLMDIDFSLMAEIDAYLSTKTANDIEAELDQYPNIRLIYKKYNCIRTTEAICERMFSFAGKCTIYR